MPYWVTYKDVVNYAGGKCVFVDTNEQEGFTLTAAMVERAITPKTKMIILNSPSNPSGAVFDRGEMERIVAIAKDRGIWVMTDECYHRFLYDGEPHSLAAIPGREGHGAGGRIAFEDLRDDRLAHRLRAGSGAGGGRDRRSCKAMRRPIRLRSRRRPRSKRLRGPQESVGIMLAEYKKRRDYVIGRLRAMPGVTAQMPQGAFYAYPNVSAAFKNGITNSLQFSEKLLAEEFVAVVPGEAFGTNDHIRISYATSMKELERGLDRLQRFIAARV